MSEKSLAGGRRRIGRAFLAARPARANDADAFAIVSPPHGIGHDEHASGPRPAQPQEPRFCRGMTQVRTVEAVGIAEHGCCLFKGHSVLGTVRCGLPRIPLEHSSVYTKRHWA